MTPLVELIGGASQARLRPDRSPYRALLWQDQCRIAAQTGVSLAEVERTALEAGIVPERYSRNQKTLDNTDQLRLLAARVAIIGLGGLGGTVTEILARIGVGQLTLVDGDTVDESNLNRQLLSSPALLGRSKAEIAGERVATVNPAVRSRIVNEFLTADNAAAILAGSALAIDCLDNIPARFLLAKGCTDQAIPLVSAAIGGTSGQATVLFPGDDGLEKIYGPAPTAPTRGSEAAFGTLPFTAWQLATVECAEAVNLILGGQSSLHGRLLLRETRSHQQELVELGGP
jgi:molybdopterin/thiamine biosynthesis adenylyltransferase